MSRHLSYIAAICFALIAVAARGATTAAPQKKASPGALSNRQVPIYPFRQQTTDLEVTGMIAGLTDDAVGYIRYADLAALPKITITIHGDENFSEIDRARTIDITGIYLNQIAKAVGAVRDADLISATCSDGYQAHYPASYVAAHQPVLALTINHLRVEDWARQPHHANLGPYFVTHANFIPAFRVLSHADQPQVPANIVRLTFTTTRATFGAIEPNGSFPETSPERIGFTVAKQNCLRCHNHGSYGGAKSGRTWSVLATWAYEQPAYFANYVHDPKAFEPYAKMPGFPEYDSATLHALTAYFRTLAEPGAEHGP